MTASPRDHRLVRGFIVSALAIGALGLTAPLAAAEPISSVHDAVVRAPAARSAPAPARRPKPADEATAKPDAENTSEAKAE
jgi:hypothetical protein